MFVVLGGQRPLPSVSPSNLVEVMGAVSGELGYTQTLVKKQVCDTKAHSGRLRHDGTEVLCGYGTESPIYDGGGGHFGVFLLILYSSEF